MNSNSEIHKHLLESMEYFHNFCEEHSLKYVLLGGSLLGAIRHEGFIPWDDDVDVGMQRKDYERLLKMKKEFSEPFLLDSIEFNNFHPTPYAKLQNKKLLVQEDGVPNIDIGVWIDIFPLDFTFHSNKFQKIQINFIRKIRMVIYFKQLDYGLNNKKIWKILIIYFLKKLPFSFFKIVLKISEKMGIVFSNKKIVTNLYGAWGIKESAPYNIFEERKLYKFEDKEFYGIANYDFWLSKVYGDYMKLPNKESQKASHIKLSNDK